MKRSIRPGGEIMSFESRRGHQCETYLAGDYDIVIVCSSGPQIEVDTRRRVARVSGVNSIAAWLPDHWPLSAQEEREAITNLQLPGQAIGLTELKPEYRPRPKSCDHNFAPPMYHDKPRDRSYYKYSVVGMDIFLVPESRSVIIHDGQAEIRVNNQTFWFSLQNPRSSKSLPKRFGLLQTMHVLPPGSRSS